MGSETQVKNIMECIDEGLKELDELEEKLERYDKLLQVSLRLISSYSDHAIRNHILRFFSSVNLISQESPYSLQEFQTCCANFLKRKLFLFYYFLISCQNVLIVEFWK